MNTDQVRGHSLDHSPAATLGHSFKGGERAHGGVAKPRKRDVGLLLLFMGTSAHMAATSAAPNYTKLAAAVGTSGAVNPERLPAIAPAPREHAAEPATTSDVVRDYLSEQPAASFADIAALRDALRVIFPTATFSFSRYIDHEEGWHRLVLGVSADLPADEQSRLEDDFYQRADASEQLARALGHVIVTFS